MTGTDRVSDVGADTDRYRLLVDAITDYAIYMVDPDGVVTSWNAGAQRFTGYGAGEILGRNYASFFTPEDRAGGLPQTALRVAAEEGRFEREGWRVRKDDSRFWAHVVIDPIPAAQGGVLGFAVIIRDLTERREADEALRLSEQQFRLLVQGVTDYAIYLLDREGHVTNWNAGAERIKGYRPEEVIGSHFSRFYPEEDQAAGLPARGLEAAAREGRWEHEGLRVRKDGSRFVAHVIIDAIRDERGEVIGFAKVTRDITERMETQKRLEEAREALLQSQKLEAIGQLTGGVAHDFNNLLMAVLGSLELVRKRTPYDPRVTPLLDNAIQGAKRGSVLTQRMLAFARRQELRLEPVDLAALARGMLAFMQRTIGPAIRVETRFPPGLPLVRSDPAQLENALLNLVVNARDAMPESGGVVTIAGAVRSDAGGCVCLSVTDSGSGMDEETLARAADPFFTTKGVGKGTGLGLSMVHGLAAQSGGRLNIRSRRGEGTTVELFLPLAGEEDHIAAAPLAPRQAPESRRRLTILAVDDDGLVLMNTAALLEDLGHEVLQAGSGREALELLRQRPDTDLVITDQAMPAMTGLQLAGRLRRTLPELPVILATGYAEMPEDAGRDLVRLAKPFTQEELAAAVAGALEQAVPART